MAFSVEDEPQWEHDDDCCTFLGRHRNYDLYVCPQAGVPTVIARYGNGGPDYLSGVGSSLEPLREAAYRALKYLYSELEERKDRNKELLDQVSSFETDNLILRNRLEEILQVCAHPAYNIDKVRRIRQIVERML